MASWKEEKTIAHALGKIEKFSYTGSREAFEENYKKGFKCFEADLYLTSDDKVVLTHDWNHASMIQNADWSEECPPTEEVFLSLLIYGKYTPLSFIDLLAIMKKYPDIWIITDTKYTDEIHIRRQFNYIVNTAKEMGVEDVLKRLVIQIYNEEMYDIIERIYAFDSYIFTLYQRWEGDIEEFKQICGWCVNKGVQTITMGAFLCADEIIEIAKGDGIDVYVHTVNNILEIHNVLKKGVHGVYTDCIAQNELTHLNIWRKQFANVKKKRRYRQVIKEIMGQKEMRELVSNLSMTPEKQIVIFGAGTYGHQIYDILSRQKIHVKYFCDNNKSGRKDADTGLDIIGLEMLKDIIESCNVLLCIVNPTTYRVIIEQLTSIGIKEEQLYGMREYITKLTIENLEAVDTWYGLKFGMCSLILGIADILLYWKTGNVLCLTIVFFGVSLFSHTVNWAKKHFPDMEFRTMLYQLRSPLRGTGHQTWKMYSPCLCFAIIETILLSVCWEFLSMKDMVSNWLYITVLAIGALLTYCKTSYLGIPEYVRQRKLSSNIFEEYYVNPDSVQIKFPVKKKNVIRIFLESMETGYAFMRNEADDEYSLIPNLSTLVEENISFSHTEGLGGIKQLPGTEWTMAALLVSTAGIPFLLPIQGNSAGEYEKFLPGLVTMGEILEDNGYENYFMCGSDADFGGRGLYFRTHGNYHIFDVNTARTEMVIDKEYDNGFWGMEDELLYKYAKRKLDEICSAQPFNFTMLTVDTHFPNGYKCSKCPQMYSDQIQNAIRCADSQLSEFLEWIKKQEWYKDTVVVITGDHLIMGSTIVEKMGDKRNRSVYNCFVNADKNKSTVNERHRNTWMADMFPTTLAALNAEIQGDTLGLGVNLFSNKPSLAESMGIEKLSDELRRYSKFYEVNFIKKHV